MGRRKSAQWGGSTHKTIAVILAGIVFVLGCSSPALAAEGGSLVKSGGEWIYQTSGKQDISFTGLVKNQNGWFYVRKGKVDFNYTGLVKKAQNEWYYVKNGKVNFNANGLFKNENGWWYVKNGKIDFGYTGFAENKYGTWYVRKGKVAKELTSIVKGTIDGQKKWWYIKNGKVQFNAETVAKNENGWWYVKNGSVDFGYTDFAKNNNGWWYVKRGNVDLKTTGLAKGTVNGEKTWWYAKRSKVDTSQNAPVKNNKGLWYVKDGKVDFSFTGIATYNGTSYYFEKGKAKLTARKAVSSGGTDYNVLDGKAYKVESEKDRTLFRALSLLDNITTEDMTKEEKLKAAWDELQPYSNYKEYNPRIPHYKGMDWPEIYANDIFVDGGGNCLSLAAAFGYMAKAIGYEEVYGCNSGGHGWTEIDGLIYDVEWSRWHHTYTYYGMSYDTKMDQNYKGAIAAAGSSGYEWMKIKI